MTDPSAQSPLPEATFSFALSGQSAGPWQVMAFEAQEGLSQLYECVLDLVADDPAESPDALLGQTGCFSVERGGLHNPFFGMARRVEDLGWASGKRRARVFWVPRLWALSQTVQSRIFQQMALPAIVQEVVKAAGYESGDTLHLSLQGQNHLPREYCVQYRESDLAFLMRLLEEEGVTFFFEHPVGESQETLEIVDSAQEYGQCQTLDGGEPIRLAGPEGAHLEAETVRSFQWQLELQPTAVLLRDFDFTRPAAVSNLTAQQPSDALGARPVYDYPGEFVLAGYDSGSHQYQQHDGDARAELRQRVHVLQAKVARGEGNVTGFHAGVLFQVEIQGRLELDDEDYLVQSVRHSGRAPEVLTADAHAHTALDRYANQFQAIPTTQAFVPACRTPRPSVRGPQTATVVDADGKTSTQADDVYTDFHGRIRVRFHWDLGSQPGGTHDTGWVRVAQPWAGAGFGAVFIPRVGMEVVVQFLEGNPDRPLVTGCLYNGQNPTPYELPAEKTRSGLRTSSSPGGKGYNELRFEDSAGHEEIHLRAQRNLSEQVLADHSLSVGGDQHLSVTGAQDQTIQKTRSLKVTQGSTTSIGQDDELTVSGGRAHAVSGDETIVVGGNQNVVVGHGKGSAAGPPPAPGAGLDVKGEYHVKATQRVRLEVAGTFVDFDGQSITLDAATTLTLHVGGSTLTMTSSEIHLTSATIKLNGGASVLQLDGNADLLGGTVAKVHQGGSELTLNGDAMLKGVANTHVEAATVVIGNGTEVQVTAGGATGVFSGGLVKLNA